MKRIAAVLALGIALAGWSGGHLRAQSTAAGATEADIEFMQNMVLHHAQALKMASLVPGRTSNEAIKLIAERINVSQRDEIAMMKRWLEAHGQTLPDTTTHEEHGHSHGGDGMPGMATEGELDSLASLRDTKFDRWFLHLMIRHHQGAITMVKELFAHKDAGRDPQLFTFASEVDADQNAEIRRMRSVLESLPK